MSGQHVGERRLRILLADDAADLRLLLRVVLEGEEDFEVVGEAGDGVEAVRLATCLQPDLVLLDLSMPVMDGLEAIPLIRRNAPSTVIVVLSAFRAGQLAGDALGRGADAYLEKGLAPDELAERIRRFWGAAAGRRELSRGPGGRGRER